MNYRYRNDDEMKDSGVEWIGKIPKEWNVTKLKNLATIVTGNTPSKNDEKNYENGIVQWIKPDNITDDFKITESKDRLSTYGLKQARLIPKNSALVCCIGTVGKVGISEVECTTNQQINSVVFDNKNWVNGFGIYALISSRNEHERNSSKVVVSILNKSQQGNINMPVPKSEEQQKISKFLNEKTAQFDSIISKKEVLIEKLEEAKKSLISEVVTGKVKVVKSSDGYELVERKKEEMKDSGVEWLGEIPKEWDLKRSNYVFKFSKGLSITKENLQDEGIPCINYGEIHSKYGFEVNPKRHKLKCVTEEYFNSNPNALIKYGDFVFADTSEDIQGCGNFSYLNAEDSIFAGYHTIIARPIKTVSSRYLAYLFDSDDWRIQIRTKVSGIKVFSITQSILKTTKVILPTLSEQKLIVDYLDNKFVNINSMINNMKKQIEKLKEAKQSLISEAVTGKIEILD